MILLAIVVFGLIAGYFYYTQALQDQTAIAPLNITLDDSLIKFKNLSYDFSPFDALQFKSLQIFGESPVSPGVTGRTDIFAPF